MIRIRWLRSLKLIKWRNHFKDCGIWVSVLDYQEEGTFGVAGFEDPIEGILGITTVHPLREDYAKGILAERQLDSKQIIDQRPWEERSAKSNLMAKST